MHTLSAEESSLLQACLGSHDPQDKIWMKDGNTVAVSPELACIIEDSAPAEIQGGVLGLPLIEFLKRGGGDIVKTPEGLTVERGKASLRLLQAQLSDFAWPTAPTESTTIGLTANILNKMGVAVAANAASGLQVTHFEMLGVTIRAGKAYSLSLDAYVELRETFPPDYSVVLPAAWLTQVVKLLQIEKVDDSTQVFIYYNDKLVWTRIGRITLLSAVPIMTAWIDLTKLSVMAQTGAAIDKDLSALLPDFPLLQSLSPTLQLSKTGVRCGTTQAWYETSDITLPEDCKLSLEKLGAVLPLTPRITKVLPKIVQLEGTDYIALLSTAAV